MDLNDECKNDNDCSDKQYCYDISRRCVDILDCSRYNRMKGKIPARDPSQCGPCIKGYSTELLATGKETPPCKYTENQVGFNAVLIICIIVTGVFFVVVVLCLCCYRRCNRRMTSRCNSRSNNVSDVALEVESSSAMAVASAPEDPEEQKPFVKLFGKKRCDYIPHNNNERRETSQYQTGIPFTLRYTPINTYARTNNNTDENNFNCNNSPPCGQVAIYVAENHRNMETEEREETEETDLHNNDELPHNNENGDTTDSASAPNNQGEKIKSNRIQINQMVQQSITINLNRED